MLETLLKQLYETHFLPRQETAYVISHLDDAYRPVLYDYAHRLRLKYYSNKVYLRGLVEFSNMCKQNCLYCGIRAGNHLAARYRLTPEQIIDCCEEGYTLGYRTFVLQSGEDPWFTTDILSALIRTVKLRHPDAAVTLSIGERSYDDYKVLQRAGADRFLMRHETASDELYSRLHPTMTLQNRVRCLLQLKSLGYQVGAGFMVGLPGQTPEHLAEDLHFLKALQPDMIGIGPFIPHRNTPLANEKGGTLVAALDMIALSRLFVPDALLPATTAMGSLHPRGRERALRAGANVLMPNLSPSSVRPKYSLYENKVCTGDESAQCRACIEVRVRAAGFEVDMGRGDSFHNLHPSSVPSNLLS